MQFLPTRRLAAAFALGAVVAACDTQPTAIDADDLNLTSTAEPVFGARPSVTDPNNPLIPTTSGVADLERFEVCKRWDGPGPHGVAEFSIEIDRDRDGAIDTTFTRTSDQFYGPDANGWSCYELWEHGANGGDVIVTETGVIGGAHPYVVTSTADFITTGVVAPPTSGGAVVRGIVGGQSGVTALFVNTAQPPLVGGQGCTPGYWKQRHHFDSWAAPYTPDTPFSAVFEDAFPGKTLLDVVKQGGGGLKALGRHAVAALLNGASAGVSYDLTDSDVVAQFNAAYPGSKRDYTALKNQLVSFNEQGCPLN